VESSCEFGIESLGSMKFRETIEWLHRVSQLVSPSRYDFVLTRHQFSGSQLRLH
jgi:hypothetical protein